MDTDFDAVIAGADYPVWVLTTAAGEQRSGCLVGFATQVGIRPRRFLAGVSKTNHTYRIVRAADHAALHLLASTGMAVARLFASETGDEVDKFTRCETHAGPAGLPILAAAAGWFAGRIVRQHDLGDHIGLLLDPVAAQPPDRSVTVLRYLDVAGLHPGHEA